MQLLGVGTGRLRPGLLVIVWEYINLVFTRIQHGGGGLKRKLFERCPSNLLRKKRNEKEIGWQARWWKRRCFRKDVGKLGNATLNND
jgi:hypothetical protein